MKTLVRSAFIACALLGVTPLAHADRHERWEERGERGRFEGRGPVVRLRFAPPAPRVEVRGVAPSPRHFWHEGHWRWEGGRHVWWGGRWELGRPGYQWVGPRWANQGGEWAFFDGYWQPPQEQVVVEQPAPVGPAGEIYAESAPPPPQFEAIPVAPSPRHLWIAGHWTWQGRWVWAPGHYEFRRGAGWEAAHWVQFGPRWRYMPGHWR